MRFNSLPEWLNWQQNLYHKTIDLGLERFIQVVQLLNINKIAGKVITVAGTNGKGSTVALYEHWLRAEGYTVASFTSPHLLDYNERIKLNLAPVSDAELCQAFARIDEIRQGILLTYFEFSTLAALYLIQKLQPDYAILEIGLGGRLDCVNIIDPDLAHITTIGLDHQYFLGNTRDSIALEKAGILRPGIDMVCNEIDPPESLLSRINELETNSRLIGQDYNWSWSEKKNKMCWSDKKQQYYLLPRLPGVHQRQNLAGVLAGLDLLLNLENYSEQQIEQNFSSVNIAGRYQQIESSLPITLIVDVGHNPDAAKMLAQNLKNDKRPEGKVIVILGMLEDKDCAAFVEQLKDIVDCWWLLDLHGDRALKAAELAEKILAQQLEYQQFSSVAEIFDHAVPSLRNQDILLATGSFYTVESFLHHITSA